MTENNTTDKKFILIRAGVLFVIAIILSIIIVLGLRCMNIGISENPDEETLSDTLNIGSDSSSNVQLQSASISSVPDAGVIVFREDSWEVSEVSIYVDATADPILDYLPIAPTSDEVSYEVLLLAKMWAEYNGVLEVDIDKVYVFNNQDTLYIDLPEPGMKYDALCRTVSTRFTFFTRLYPLVSGNVVSGYEDGIQIENRSATDDE